MTIDLRSSNLSAPRVSCDCRQRTPVWYCGSSLRVRRAELRFSVTDYGPTDPRSSQCQRPQEVAQFRALASTTRQETRQELDRRLDSYSTATRQLLDRTRQLLNRIAPDRPRQTSTENPLTPHARQASVKLSQARQLAQSSTELDRPRHEV